MFEVDIKTILYNPIVASVIAGIILAILKIIWKNLNTRIILLILGFVLALFSLIYFYNQNITTKKTYSDELSRLTYTITFIANGGTFSDGSLTTKQIFPNEEAAKGKKLNEEGVLPNRNGYTFKCWNEKSDGSGKDFEDGKNVTVGNNATLYAKWETEPIIYTITFDANGGIFSNGKTKTTQSFTKSEATNGKTLNGGGVPNLTEYTFICWNDKSDGRGKDFEDGQNVTIGGNATLFAKWGMEKQSPSERIIYTICKLDSIVKVSFENPAELKIVAPVDGNLTLIFDTETENIVFKLLNEKRQLQIPTNFSGNHKWDEWRNVSIKEKITFRLDKGTYYVHIKRSITGLSIVKFKSEFIGKLEKKQ